MCQWISRVRKERNHMASWQGCVVSRTQEVSICEYHNILNIIIKKYFF